MAMKHSGLLAHTPDVKRMIQVEARLFSPETFRPSKLSVLFFDKDHSKIHPAKLSRTYTLTHSDITASLTLAIAPKINESQIMGWYSRLQRDEVLAEWRKIKGEMSLHVHCHISGSHWLLDVTAPLRFHIFRNELPLVLEAFRHGDQQLLQCFPGLENAPVWIYFHSTNDKFQRIECWGALVDACKRRSEEAARKEIREATEDNDWQTCTTSCSCCSHTSLISFQNSLLRCLQKIPLKVTE